MASAVISSIVTTLWTPMVNQMKSLLKIGENMRNLEKVSGDLQVTKNDVQDKIKRATEIANDMEPTERVLNWLDKVKTMEDDVNKIEQDHTKLQKIMCLGDFPLNCWSGYKISKRAANSAKDVKELIEQSTRADMHEVTKKVVRDVQRKPGNSLLSTTNAYLDDAIKHLQDDMTSMVGIWGMGGVGKTTLLTEINNHPDVANAGFLVIWVDVSKQLNRYNLQREIAKRIDLPLEREGDSTVESQAASLSHFLQKLQEQNKKIMLLLDDLWESFDLENLGIPCHGVNKDNVPNCKVVFTTRSDEVCDQMMALQKFPAHFEQKKIKLECLEEGDAWELFKSNIGKTALDFISSDERVERHAKRVAEKCRGLPLTLVVIAKSMSSNKTLYEWEDAVNSINKLGIQEVLGEETAESVFRLLKVSYDRLKDERFRKCFLTCALWPEDYRIQKDKLIWSWLGLDLIGEFDDINEAFTRGHTIIKRLERAGLLLEAGEETELFGRPSLVRYLKLPSLVQYVKLHDIIREMALWIATDEGKNRNKWLVQVTGAEEEHKWREAEMAFTVHDGIDTPTLRLPQHNPYCPNLTAFMFCGRRRFYSSNRWDYKYNSFFQNMVALTYLDLANNGLSKVPSEITTLSQLQYLNLAGNDIDQLPKELSNLKKLKYLILGTTEHIPRGLLSGLEKLEVLDLFDSYYTKWGMEGEASIEELAPGTMAPGVNNLKGLGIAVDNMSALQLLTQINPHITLWKLCIRDLQGVQILDLSKTLLRSNRALHSLQSLSIEGSDMKEILMTSEEKRQFEKLSLFRLRYLDELTKITWKGRTTPGEFANLSEVQIIGCSKLCDVTWIAQLRHLEILVIYYCRMLEKVLTDGANQEKDDDDDDDDDVGVDQEERRTTTMILPNLKFLSLYKLRNLVSFCSPEIRFPKLKRNCVWIERCPQLDQTPFMSTTGPNATNSKLKKSESLTEISMLNQGP